MDNPTGPVFGSHWRGTFTVLNRGITERSTGPRWTFCVTDVCIVVIMNRDNVTDRASSPGPTAPTTWESLFTTDATGMESIPTPMVDAIPGPIKMIDRRDMAK